MESRKYPPYLFDVDFDALSAPPEPEVDETPPPLTFSEAELQAARDTAYEAGKAEGIAQANAGLEQEINEAVRALELRFDELRELQVRANEETMRDSVRVAATIAAKLFPDYALRHGLGEIEAFVKETISTLFPEAEVVLRVPAALAEKIDARLAPTAAATGLGEHLKVVADPALGPADCRMEWGNGGAERDCGKLMEEIDSIVARFIEHSAQSQSPAAPEQVRAPAESPAADTNSQPAQETAGDADTFADTAVPLASEPSPEPAEPPQSPANVIREPRPVEPIAETAPVEEPARKNDEAMRASAPDSVASMDAPPSAGRYAGTSRDTARNTGLAGRDRDGRHEA